MGDQWINNFFITYIKKYKKIIKQFQNNMKNRQGQLNKLT